MDFQTDCYFGSIVSDLQNSINNGTKTYNLKMEEYFKIKARGCGIDPEPYIPKIKDVKSTIGL